MSININSNVLYKNSNYSKIRFVKQLLNPKIFQIGSIISWAKSFIGADTILPDGWVECNGQILNEPKSVFNGQTLPDLNGENRFLRGSSTSGTTGGSSTHTHTISSTKYDENGSYHMTLATTRSSSCYPLYSTVVFIMKVY